MNNRTHARPGSPRQDEQAIDERTHDEDFPVPQTQTGTREDMSPRSVSEDVSNATTPTATTTAVEETLDGVRQQRDEYYDLLLRKTAEFENYRKRVERERRELSEYAAADVLKAVLPLVDDLERALQAAPATDEAAGRDPRAAIAAYRAGVELIHKQLLDLLRKKGVTPIESVGKDFDPHVHQAVTQEVSADHREGEVMQELARGYKLGDRLLRPAMVKVATRG